MHWFDMEKKKSRQCIKYFEVKGRMPVDKPKKTWDEVLRRDLETRGLIRKDPQNHAGW